MSGSESGGCLRWRHKGTNHAVKPAQLVKLDGLRIKPHGDVLAFAAKHPGALTGYILILCHMKTAHGMVTATKQLSRVPMHQWAQQHSVLTELRDKREVESIGLALDHINAGQMAQAMDVLCKRIQAIQAAKRKNGS